MKRFRKFLVIGLIIWLAIVVSGVVLVRPHLRIYKAASGTMAPLVETGDFTLGVAYLPFLPPLEPGHIVVYPVTGVPGISEERRHELHLKRVVALAGMKATMLEGDIIVPPGHLLAMGDNRDNSWDGRHYGPVPAETVLSRVVFRIWPPRRLGPVY